MAQVRWSSRLTREALNGNERTLTETLRKMQGQIEATDRLYAEAQRQTEQTRILAEHAQDQARKVGAIANTANNIYLAGNRPYVGIEGVRVLFGTLQANGVVALDEKLPGNLADIKLVVVRSVIKNYGSVSATNTSATINGFVDGRLMHNVDDDPKPMTLFPSKEFHIDTPISSGQYFALAVHKLQLNVGVNYSGPSASYPYCERERIS